MKLKKQFVVLSTVIWALYQTILINTKLDLSVDLRFNLLSQVLGCKEEIVDAKGQNEPPLYDGPSSKFYINLN